MSKREGGRERGWEGGRERGWEGGWVGGEGGKLRGRVVGEGKVYHDQFFKSQDVVVNALDNLEARRYVDR